MSGGGITLVVGEGVAVRGMRGLSGVRVTGTVLVGGGVGELAQADRDSPEKMIRRESCRE
ncbi:MAG: hypothetical protein Fur0022_15050 [Anaerolineales bacterium]